MTDQKQTDGSGLKTLEDLQRTVLIRIVDDDAEVRDALLHALLPRLANGCLGIRRRIS